MPKKAFVVEVELTINSVTCPGVWLCPNGKVSLQVHMLGSCCQTRAAEPTFPIVLDEKFVFTRTYYDVGRLATLQKVFNKDTLYVELIQWQNCEDGNVLATFQTSLAELLFPSEGRKQSLVGAEIDLLMEPMKHFPGILAPKIEVATKTTIQDKICNTETSDAFNPNMIASNSYSQQKCVENHVMLRQKPVCHSKKCHKSKKCSETVDRRPPFVVRRVADVPHYTCHCNDCTKETEREAQAQLEPMQLARKMVQTGNEMVRRACSNVGLNRNYKTSPVRVQCTSTEQLCSCGDEHAENCAVCAKYEHYFESKSIKSRKRNQEQSCTCGQAGANDSEAFADDLNVQLSNYPPANSHSKRSSMAQRLHSRLSETLNNRCVDCRLLIDNNNCDCCECDALQTCASGTLGQFYKKLYSCGNKYLN